ncbi:Ligand-gated ion channel [Nesidiocoris tenuis]|uniref:Ligand-gated ion channel n=1 Tax=Nesidiocoris tenuis TaxID=355587 RepID=A0ABN7AB45_9HEMI|nr:Ligand-gated ion channel [Nesidiocoris tenuis]
MNDSFVYALTTDGTADDALSSLRKIAVAFDSQIVLFAENRLFDVYRITENHPLTVTSFGYWNPKTGDLTVGYKTSRWNLRGATLKASTVVKEFERKLVGKKEYYDAQYLTSVDDLPRCSCKLHQYAEFVMNFKTDLGITPDWGYFNKTTQKFDRNSMYGQLEDGKIEFGLALSWMYSARVNVAFFAPATRILKSCVVFRHPPAGASMHAFALPFTSGTWIVTFVYVFTISVCLSVMRHQRQLNETDDPPGERQFSANFFLVAGIMCLQGSLIESIRIPLRILTFFLQLLALMVYSYYGATILGFLLTPTPRTITTVERLLDSHMDLWVENVSFHRHHFHAGISARATKYYDEAIKGPTPDQDKIIDRIVGLKSVQKGGTALYGLAPNLFENVQKLFSSSEICSLHYIHMLDMQTAIPVRKQSPYREMYNIAIQRILETGFADYEERTWHAQKPDCVGSEATAAVKLEATFIALMIYAVGFAIALIIFAVERILPPKSNWGKSKKRLTDVTYL